MSCLRAAHDASGLAISEKMHCKIRGLNKGIENTQDGKSLCQIRDADIAKEMLGLTTANILAQAGISVLAQANTSNEEVLALLR